MIVGLFRSKKKDMEAFDGWVGELVEFGDLMDLPHHYGGLTSAQSSEIEARARSGELTRREAIDVVKKMIADNISSREAAGEIIGASGTLTELQVGADVFHNVHGKGYVAQVVNEDGEHGAVVSFKQSGIQVIELPTSEMELWRE